MNKDLKRWLISGLGLGKKTVNDIENEITRLAKKYGWTKQEARELLDELKTEGNIMKGKASERVKRVRARLKETNAEGSKDARKRARKIIKKASKTAAAKIRKAGKRLARKL